MLKIICGPIAEVSPLHRDCYVAYREGDTRQYLGTTEAEAIGKCFREYSLNMGPAVFTYESVQTPISFGSMERG